MIKSPYSLLVLFKFSIFSCLGLGRILILGIYPFLSGYPICWPIIFHNNLYGLLYFCSVSCNISSFIYNFINFSLLSFFYYSSRHDWATSLSLFTFMHWRRKWQPTPVFWPGESQGQGSLVGCHLWGRTQSDTIEET